jgi:uncharacterized protein
MTQTTELNSRLKALERVAIACSGGVDSTFLLAAALEVLGPEKVLAVVVDHPLMPAGDVDTALEVIRGMGSEPLLLRMDPLSIAEVAGNAADRCYHCKKEIFAGIRAEAARRGYESVLDGSNADDPLSYRPGMKALEELAVLSPLRDAGMTKELIREESRRMGLATADRPAAPCLATRFPYNTPLDLGHLAMVDRAETALKERGFKEVRVRMHELAASLEIDPGKVDLLKVPGTFREVERELLAIGFAKVTVDPRGYRSGSMDEDIVIEKAGRS